MSTNESETRTRILEATWNLMVERRGQGVRMSDIAGLAGVSRQTVYLHFASRAELLVATTHYGDKLRGLEDRLQDWLQASTGIERLRTYVEFWGNYVPEIYGIARALMASKETDEAAAVAWNERMDAVHQGCHTTIVALEREKKLAPQWTVSTATDLFWTLLSIRNWELLTTECGWSTQQYVTHLQTLVERTFVRS